LAQIQNPNSPIPNPHPHISRRKIFANKITK